MMQEFGTISPDVEARLKRTLDDGLQSLVAGQNSDGGWGWWSAMQSDPYISAYVLFGLTRAQEAGSAVPGDTIQRAVDYLRSTLYTPTMSSETWQLDRLAFIHYALAQAGAGDLAAAQSLYDVRDQLSPWGAALTGLILDQLSPGSQEARSLFSDLEATALRSATGAHWEEAAAGFNNLDLRPDHQCDCDVCARPTRPGLTHPCRCGALCGAQPGRRWRLEIDV